MKKWDWIFVNYKKFTADIHPNGKDVGEIYEALNKWSGMKGVLLLHDAGPMSVGKNIEDIVKMITQFGYELIDFDPNITTTLP